MTVIGLRVNGKALAPSVGLTEGFTLVNGRMTNNTVLQTQVSIFRKGEDDLRR